MRRDEPRRAEMSVLVTHYEARRDETSVLCGMMSTVRGVTRISWADVSLPCFSFPNTKGSLEAG